MGEGMIAYFSLLQSNTLGSLTTGKPYGLKGYRMVSLVSGDDWGLEAYRLQSTSLSPAGRTFPAIAGHKGRRYKKAVAVGDLI